MKFKLQIFNKLTFIFLLSFLLIKCGGAGIDGSGSPLEKTSSSSGTISGFGSVIVNGVRYDTDNAQILISGDSATEDDLEVGHYVTVIGEINADNQTGTANEIRFQPRLVGTISSIDPNTERFSILEQQVQITNSTVFDSLIIPDDISGLSVGQSVRISGSLESNDIISATRIDLLDSIEVEIFGQVTSFNASLNELQINNLEVNFENAEIDGELSVGVNVTVAGIIGNNNVLIADEIEVSPFFLGDIDEIDDIIIAGIISDTFSDSEFEVNEVPVEIQSSTILLGGNAEDIREDIFVEIFGSISDGILIADVVEFQDINPVFLFGFIEDLEIQDGVIPTASFVISGQSVETNLSTLFEDDSGITGTIFNASLLRNDDPVIVEGNFVNGVLEANYVERQDFDSEFDQIEIIGFATNITETGFNLFDFNISFDDNTEFFLNGLETTFGELIGVIADNPVFVEGIVEGETLTASLIEVELFEFAEF